MAEPWERPGVAARLQVSGLNVFYGHSHALQGVSLAVEDGVLAVVGRNGMGKTTLCKTIMGLLQPSSGSIRFDGAELIGLTPADIARRGIGYVPQGRRLWPSLTVDEHLRLVPKRAGPWRPERIYDTFPRLAERRGNLGRQLSGGEQQMLAIARALLTNPRALVMDEPTEGLAPVIVAQVEEMLVRLANEGALSVLLIEQNIGVAAAISRTVAIMVNGRIHRTIDSARLAADRDLQQRLLGVGRHAHEDADTEQEADPAARPVVSSRPESARGPVRVYLSNPATPTRWSEPVPVARILAASRTTSGGTSAAAAARIERRPLSSDGVPVVLVVGTLDTKGVELRFLRDILRQQGLRAQLVDLSTSGAPSSADVPPHQLAAFSPRGPGGIMGADRGQAVAAMAEAFEAWLRRQRGIAGVIAAGGSGGTSMVAPGMRALPIGVPKLIISTVAASDVRRYVGASDITMMHAVTDVLGLNSISRQILANGANALAGMVKARLAAPRGGEGAPPALPTIGMTMFGVTTPCVQRVRQALASECECLVFHATGIGGQAMEKLIGAGSLSAVLDITTTEVCDLLLGGVFAAAEDRLQAVIRARIPYVGSCGALDMVNFGPPDTIPATYAGRLFHRHNPQVTLMRTTPQDNARIGAWIGDRLNQMDGPVRFLLPTGGVSALDAPGQPFHDPQADAALFDALERTVRQTAGRQLIRLPHHINDPAFAAALVASFRLLHATPPARTRLRR